MARNELPIHKVFGVHAPIVAKVVARCQREHPFVNEAVGTAHGSSNANVCRQTKSIRDAFFHHQSLLVEDSIHLCNCSVIAKGHLWKAQVAQPSRLRHSIAFGREVVFEPNGHWIDASNTCGIDENSRARISLCIRIDHCSHFKALGQSKAKHLLNLVSVCGDIKVADAV